jgi:hypothetical protein
MMFLSGIVGILVAAAIDSSLLIIQGRSITFLLA